MIHGSISKSLKSPTVKAVHVNLPNCNTCGDANELSKCFTFDMRAFGARVTVGDGTVLLVRWSGRVKENEAISLLSVSQNT